MDRTVNKKQYVHGRIANACDGCKARKVKCDGELPCSYCSRRRKASTCHYTSPASRRRPRSQNLPSESASYPTSGTTTNIRHSPVQTSSRPSPVSSSARVPTTPNGPSPVISQPTPHGLAVPASPDRDETEVPREARLLCDSQGKLIFIGDCAPLSFFQTVRRLVSSRVDERTFAPETSQYSVLENAFSKSSISSASREGTPVIHTAGIGPAVSAYLGITAGVVDLFANDALLLQDVSVWATHFPRPDGVGSAVNYLVLAIGYHQTHEVSAELCFIHGQKLALSSLGCDLSVGTVQAFTLITLHMLITCQLNGAFLFFGIAVRAAYSIGLHRTEVNSRFGSPNHKQRDRLWKSLRIVDLFLSTSMGRPPATSDLDCTVSYAAADDGSPAPFDILSASVQIFLVIEDIVVEVYSQRKISLQLTEGLSRQLRTWSMKWVRNLNDAARLPCQEYNIPRITGACQVLASYYYAVMLVSRPFLMYELHRRLSPENSSDSRSKVDLTSEKSMLADACINAASLMLDPILEMIEKGAVVGKLPLLVSWLFASSLVLGLGLLGGFGRILEKDCRRSITGLEYFAKNDTHARQYSFIAKSLLTTASEFVEKQEVLERRSRTENSSQLFGLTPAHPSVDGPHEAHGDKALLEQFRAESPFGALDSIFASSWPTTLEAEPDISFATGVGEIESGPSLEALNLFPLLEGDGHIDLAHYL